MGSLERWWPRGVSWAVEYRAVLVKLDPSVKGEELLVLVLLLGLGSVTGGGMSGGETVRTAPIRTMRAKLAQTCRVEGGETRPCSDDD